MFSGSISYMKALVAMPVAIGALVLTTDTAPMKGDGCMAVSASATSSCVCPAGCDPCECPPGCCATMGKATTMYPLVQVIPASAQTGKALTCGEKCACPGGACPPGCCNGGKHGQATAVSATVTPVNSHGDACKGACQGECDGTCKQTGKKSGCCGGGGCGR